MIKIILWVFGIWVLIICLITVAWHFICKYDDDYDDKELNSW